MQYLFHTPPLYKLLAGCIYAGIKHLRLLLGIRTVNLVCTKFYFHPHWILEVHCISILPEA
jgi:hypothetical protein